MKNKREQIFYEAHQKATNTTYVLKIERARRVMSSSPSLHFLLLITFSIVGGCLYTVCSNKFGLRNNVMFVQYIAQYLIQNLLEHSLCIYASIQFTDGQINLPS